jgi:hypothetical protein
MALLSDWSIVVLDNTNWSRKYLCKINKSMRSF